MTIRNSQTIYELIGYDGMYAHKQPALQMFAPGLTAYKARQWTQAMTLFQEVLRLAPDDNPSKLYLERCADYLRNPPSDDWDGVYEMHTK